jgi:nicotinate-nucleotide pyrophosphorylase (carboxylating)
MSDPAAYDHPDVAAIIRLALDEDLRGSADVTCRALVPPGSRLRATITAKQSGVICGLPLFTRVFAALGGGVTMRESAADGTVVKPGDVIARFDGDAAVMLQGERTALNLAQRLSGTATATRRLVDAVAGTRARILDTRKTTPGLRVLQKHAVLAGGGDNHRHGLHDAVLIKENHIALMAPGPGGSGPAEAVRRARAAVGAAVLVEVEIERLDDLAPVIAAGADIVLLDNLPPDSIREAVALRDRACARPPAADEARRPRVLLEASGGISLDSVRAFAASGVDRISTGSMTHSAPVLDL